MKVLITLATMSFLTTPAIAGGHNNDHHVMNKEECVELKEGILELLQVADYYWTEIEKDPENKELYESVAFYSQQAANYSTVYDVWCD
jgi:hypothetical protein